MIFWKDFILDDILGPILNFPETKESEGKKKEDESCRRKRLGSPKVMDDAREVAGTLIQETGQVKRPARMVGLSSLDSSAAQTRTEASREHRANSLRRKGDS